MIFRDRLFGKPGRGKPGTVVKVKGFKEPAYLKAMAGLARVIWNDGLGACLDEEVITPRKALDDFIPMRLWVPYGFWSLKDGSRIFFSRDYKPLWRVTEEVTAPVDPWLWINDIEDERHFYLMAGDTDWDAPKAMSLALQYLVENRIFELPRLVEAMPYLFHDKAESFSSAVKLMMREQSLAANVA